VCSSDLTKPFTENNSRCEETDDNQHHGEVYNCHQHGAEKKRIPKIIEFLNIAGMVLRKRAMSGKIYIMTIAYATTATAKIAVMIVQNAFSNRR